MGSTMMTVTDRNRTLPSAVLPTLPAFVPPLPLIDTPVSPLAASVSPKMRITLDPNMKVSEDDDTLDLSVIDDVSRPATTKAGFIAFFACLGFAYLMAIVATLAITGSPAGALFHHLRSAIGG